MPLSIVLMAGLKHSIRETIDDSLWGKKTPGFLRPVAAG